MSLPESWIDRLFARFSAVYGAQRVGAMFPTETHAEVRATWATQLGRFEPDTLRAALQDTIDTGEAWPPTLAEFVATCQRAAQARRAHAPAVALPAPTADPAVVERAVADAMRSRPRQSDRAWAHRIIARVDAGESVPIACADMARRALRVAA